MRARTLWNTSQRRDGFTIVEVVVAALIFAITVAGAMGAVSSLRAPAAASKEDITAAFIGKQVLEDLRSAVDAETWASGDLSNGVHTLANMTVGGVTYTPTYTVSDDPSGTQAKKVDLTVTW